MDYIYKVNNLTYLPYTRNGHNKSTDINNNKLICYPMYYAKYHISYNRIEFPMQKVGNRFGFKPILCTDRDKEYCVYSLFYSTLFRYQ